MTVATELMSRGLHALAQLLVHPFYYIGILFIVLQYRRQIAFERKLFSTRLHSLLSETWRTVLWGWAGGLLASAAMAFIGATIDPGAVVLLWLISLALIFIRVRFMCWAYAVGVIGIVQTVAAAFPGLERSEGVIGSLAQSLLGLNVPSMLALVAVLHLVEAVYVRRQGHRFGTPMFFESKRGKIVGGYQLQGFWPVVLFLIVPLQGGGGPALPWTPLLGGSLWANGWTIIGFPVMIGFAEMTMSQLPRDKVRISARRLALYAAALLGFAALAAWLPWMTLPAALVSIGLHEALVWFSRWDEARRQPIYVHSEKGLTVLGILPRSPAEEIGIQVGETVHKVNGQRVRSKRELHQAMQQNAAFCKLEILNLAGESKFLKRAVFSGEHHQLGIILAPDQDALYYAEEKQTHMAAYLTRKLTGLLTRKGNTRSL